jgi:predicted RNA-binding Zn-ribbon protein involved in translation (DUF1610 family)
MIGIIYLLLYAIPVYYFIYRVLFVARYGDEHYCRCCGYNVRGLTGFRCPECGNDLKQVGIVRGRPALEKKWLAIIILAYLLFIAAVAVATW